MDDPGAHIADSWMLLLDTCGEVASVALARGSANQAEVVQERHLEERSASRNLLHAVRDVLNESGLAVGDLALLGVVSGPGSFTGVRVGMACAKGLCEACSLPMLSISRLAILSAAAKLTEGHAVLHAGRGQVYVRTLRAGASPVEELAELEEFCRQDLLTPVAFAEEPLRTALQVFADVRYTPLSAASALPLVMAALGERSWSDLEFADANYVRDEGAIYRRQAERPRL